MMDYEEWKNKRNTISARIYQYDKITSEFHTEQFPSTFLENKEKEEK